MSRKPSTLSWPQRFMRAFPPMPDGLWVGFFLVMIFAGGILTGFALYGGLEARRGREQAQDSQRPSLQHQLEALEQRLRALEQRQP